MSTIRDPAIITAQGRQMMTAGGDISYTKAVLFGQDISHLTSDQVKALTTIGSPLREVKVGISDKQNTDRGTTVILEATFQNDNLANDLPYTAVGFFAQKGNDEKLIAVAVANTGAYLAATSPDGVATDALDLKLAIKIGDATNVTATVDPAGSVTPATLNGAINKLDHDLMAQIDTKADKATVDEEVGKIDFSPYARIVDVYSKTDANKLLDAKADKTALNSYDTITDVDSKIKTVTDLANTKVDATYSYSKAELDKKLLALSTDTSGKVNADQVATMIEGKADKTDVDAKIKTVTDLANTKANTVDVYTKTETDNQINKFDLSKVKFRKQFLNGDGDKVDKTWSATKNDDGTYTIDLFNDDWTAAKLSDVICQLPSKADKSNTYTKNDVDNKVNEAKSNAQSTANQIWGEVNSLKGKQTKDSADANALSETGVYYCSSPAKNFPVSQWGTLVTSNGNGERASQLYFPDDNTAVWFRTFCGDWRGWVRLANIDDVNNAKSSLTSSINAVSDKVNVTVPLFRRITAGNTWNDILGASNGDTPVLVSIRDEGGANTLGDFSAAVAFGGGDTKGVLDVAYGDHTARIIGGNGNTPVWHEDIAWKSDISNLQNIINQQNQTIQSLTTRLTNAENEINYIKANYVEGRRFPASQEAQANSWENENPQRIAFIER